MFLYSIVSLFVYQQQTKSHQTYQPMMRALQLDIKTIFYCKFHTIKLHHEDLKCNKCILVGSAVALAGTSVILIPEHGTTENLNSSTAAALNIHYQIKEFSSAVNNSPDAFSIKFNINRYNFVSIILNN